MSSIQGFVIDLDGTLYCGERVVPGSALFMQWLNRVSIPYLLVTNCPSRTPQQIVTKLKKLGIETDTQHILTSGTLAAQHLREQGFRRVFLIGERPTRKALEDDGLLVTQQAPDCVLVAWDRKFRYDTINLALWHLQKAIPLFCTNPDRTIPHGTTIVAHTAALCAAIETASGCRAHYLGKPGTEMAQTVTKRLGIPAHQLCMIGDNYDTDIAFAHRNGMQSILISPREIRDSSGERPYRPNRIVTSLAELIDDRN